MKRAVLLILMGLMWFVVGGAQTPAFSPIRLVEDEGEAQFSWTVSLAYHPQGSTGAGYDTLGKFYTFVRFADQWQSSLSMSWSFASCHKIGTALIQNTTAHYERRQYASSVSDETFTSRGISHSSYYEYRIAPGNALDPRFRLSYRSPSRFGLAASVNRILDPVVLTAMVGLEHSYERPFNWVDVSLSAGLVANARLTFTASSGMAVPVEDAGLPSASIGLCARYSLGTDGGLYLSVQTTLHMQGQSSWIAPSVSIRGRHP